MLHTIYLQQSLWPVSSMVKGEHPFILFNIVCLTAPQLSMLHPPKLTTKVPWDYFAFRVT